MLTYVFKYSRNLSLKIIFKKVVFKTKEIKKNSRTKNKMAKINFCHYFTIKSIFEYFVWIAKKINKKQNKKHYPDSEVYFFSKHHSADLHLLTLTKVFVG